MKWLLNLFRKKSVKKRFLTDIEYNTLRKERQDKTDAILDKISKVGYEGLSKSEKEFLKKL